jgi:hypothetical protein
VRAFCESIKIYRQKEEMETWPLCPDHFPVFVFAFSFHRLVLSTLSERAFATPIRLLKGPLRKGWIALM